MDYYRANLINTYKHLIKARNDLMTQAINLAMTGELKHIDEAFDVGETFHFDIDQLKGSNDVNLNMIITHYEDLENMMESLANLNAITEEDLS
ncbi:hypothetical protein LB465_17285 [Salegentibacter sp. LM13S]|uniref:hypothetical protein n=1 Tax=Salegentibacter lacus TaxID=2873599 RepID=UPI001CCC5DB6|nr:hypothetical protein [Salegentibacter lacus]MBZ9632536.1 hypothetical protein [Salegentibacter lacus]